MATSHQTPSSKPPSSKPSVRRVDAGDTAPKVDLSLSSEQLGFIITKARAFDAEVPPGGTEDGSDMADDRAVAALEDTADNPTRQELAAALTDLNVDQRNEMLALVMIGRGDFTADEWKSALTQARDVAAGDSALGDSGVKRAVKSLIETPLLADLIEDGLDELGYNVTADEMRP